MTKETNFENFNDVHKSDLQDRCNNDELEKSLPK